jgi:hypothetical protein
VKGPAKGKAKAQVRPQSSELERFAAPSADPTPTCAQPIALLQGSRKGTMTSLTGEQRQLRARFDALRRRHLEVAAEMAVGHCTNAFVREVADAFLARDHDASDKLMRPILSHALFSFPITEQHLAELCGPLFDAIAMSLSATLENDSLFAILATVSNFGQQLSDHASLYTSVHGAVLTRLAAFITDMLKQLAARLASPIIASIQSDGFVFADSEAMVVVVQHTSNFLSSCKAYNMPLQIVQAIVVETCAECDALIFNLIIETADVFTEEKLTQALQQIRSLQQQLNCLAENFNAAFPNLIEFITDAHLVLTDMPIITKRTPLMRAIVERCRPAVTLPAGLTIDDISPPIPSRASLAIPKPVFKFAFTFEWLYLEAGRVDYRNPLSVNEPSA